MTYISTNVSLALKAGDKLRLRCVHGSHADELIGIAYGTNGEITSFTVDSEKRGEDGSVIYSLPASEFDTYLEGRIEAFKTRTGIDSGGRGTGPYYFKLLLVRTKKEAGTLDTDHEGNRK
jgi:hypothetical protein